MYRSIQTSVCRQWPRGNLASPQLREKKTAQVTAGWKFVSKLLTFEETMITNTTQAIRSTAGCDVLQHASLPDAEVQVFK
jgi:hypothetical protein